MKEKVYGTKYNKVMVQEPETIEELEHLISGSFSFFKGLSEKKEKLWELLQDEGFEVESNRNIVLFRGKYVKDEESVKKHKEAKKTNR